MGQRQSLGWHHGGTAMLWICIEPPQPLMEGLDKIPTGDQSKRRDGEHCYLACTATPRSTK